MNVEISSTPSRGSDHEPLLARINLSTDTDGDGVPDDQDNCALVANPSQLDTNGDGIVNTLDLGILRLRFFQPPCPSGLVP